MFQNLKKGYHIAGSVREIGKRHRPYVEPAQPGTGDGGGIVLQPDLVSMWNERKKIAVAAANVDHLGLLVNPPEGLGKLPS